MIDEHKEQIREKIQEDLKLRQQELEEADRLLEIERNKDAPENIMELADGLKKLAELDRVKFRYYKNFKSLELSDDNLSENLPLDPENYGIKVNESNLENYKNFFNKSFVENVEMWDDILKIEKKYADAVFFKF